MSELKYGFIGEDEAQRIFLRNYLKLVLPNFELDEQFIIKATNKAEVEKLYVEAAMQGIQYYGHSLFFVGRDLDDFQERAFYEKLKGMSEKLHHQFQSKTIFFIPIQCIEHWLWYIKINKENPRSTKNVVLETKPRSDAKKEVYGAAKVSNAISNPIVDKLTKEFDIDWLSSRSMSFLNFHNRVKSISQSFD